MEQKSICAIRAAVAMLLLSNCGQHYAAPPTNEPASEPSPHHFVATNPSSVAVYTSDDGTVSEAGSTTTDDQIESGRLLYQRHCGACHSLEHNRVGPKHRGVVGRTAGGVPDFRYSKALQHLDLIWTAETLDVWLENPSQVAAGTAMGFRLRDAEDRAAIIAYLESASD